jgi:hypothetical protein
MKRSSFTIIFVFAISYLSTAQAIRYVDTKELSIRYKPDINAERVGKLATGDSVIVVSDTTKGWSKIRISERIFYVRTDFLVNSKSEISKPTILSTSSNSHLSNSNSGSSGNSYRTIHTGPRGGRYYINSKGKKVYVK